MPYKNSNIQLSFKAVISGNTSQAITVLSDCCPPLSPSLDPQWPYLPCHSRDLSLQSLMSAPGTE